MKSMLRSGRFYYLITLEKSSVVKSESTDHWKITEPMKGKQGRFRQNLLGKRIELFTFGYWL